MKGKGAQEGGTGGLPKGATGREGTVTEEKVREWAASSFWSSENVALRSDGSWIGIDVDAYGDKHGEQTLALLEAELGELPATITSTSREPYLEDGTENQSRIRFYLVPTGLQFISKLTDIDIIQRSHRYAVCAPSLHPKTGRTYVWYGYDGEPLDELPSVGDFETLPEAWLNRLILPDVDRTTGEGFTGSILEWANRCTPGDPSAVMQEWVRCIPATDFGHDQMIQMQGAFVNLGVQGEPGAMWALDRLRSEWLRAPYDTERYRTDFDVSLQGAIEKFGAFPPGPHDIPAVDTGALLDRVHQDGFVDKLMGLPHAVTPDSVRERAAWVATASLDACLTPVEAAALVWASAAAQVEGGIREQGLQAAWALVGEVALAPVRDERIFIEPAPLMAAPEGAPKDPSDPSRRVRLTDDSEDAVIDTLRWWGDEFMDVMHSLNPVMSEQYYRLNRWMILSLVFADKAYFQNPNGSKLILNFYGGVLGPSNTGKTESMEPLHDVPLRFYGGEDPSIGGDATPAGMTTALITRDGKTSLFHADEADGVLKNWSDVKGSFAGMKQRVMAFYTGKVGAIHRSTNKEQSGISATTYLNVHLTGVWQQVVDAIQPDDWISGLMNRFVWARGEKQEMSDEQMLFAPRRHGDKVSHAQRDWHGQWAAQFTAIANTALGAQTGNPAWLDVEPDVARRHLRTIKALHSLASGRGLDEQLTPTIGRLEKTIWKCAGLVAITEKRRCVQMSDYLIAVRQAEEWMENILDLVEATLKPPMARAADALVELLMSRGGGMELAEANRLPQFQGKSDGLKAIIREAEAQGRVEQLLMPHPTQIGRTIPVLRLAVNAPVVTMQPQPSTIPEGGIHI